MTRRGVLVGALAAGMLVLGGQVVATANVTWCMSDPPIPVVTPGGNHVTVNNMIYVPAAQQNLASLITDDSSTAPDGHGGTLITVHVHVPAALHGTLVVSSNHRFKVQDSASTPVGGVTLTLRLDVPIS